MRRKWTSQKGASAVEFALVLPILILITFGIIEFGVYMFNQQVITNASREGARAGIVATGSDRVLWTGGTDSIEKIVQYYAKTNLITFGTPTINDLSVWILDPAAYEADPLTDATATYDRNASFKTKLVVQVRYKYSFLIIPNFTSIPKLRQMRATTVMRYE